MSWSWKIGSVRGIAIYVHWTFLILIGWIVFAHAMQGADPSSTLKGVLFVLAIFACVLLHELGHALAAQRFGISTRDITLLPIGGVARLERMPEEPLQELWVALAGPLVNVAIAAAMYLLGAGNADMSQIESAESFVKGSFWHELMWTNIMLVAFNLIPAFPMDGGRVLRALLATRMDYVNATRTAARVGQFLAILLGFLGLIVSNYILLFIAIFVYVGAGEEAGAVEARRVIRGIPVRNAMITRFRALHEGDPLSVAIGELLAGTQHDFPVLRGSELLGMLTREDLIRGVSEGGPEQPVEKFIRRDCPSIEETEMLERVFSRMRESNCTSMPVLRGGQLQGLLNLENIGELLMIQSALQQSRQRPRG